MNPQLNKIFSKLAKEEKTELSSQKIELGLVDDFEKRGNQYNKESLGIIDDFLKSYNSSKASLIALKAVKKDILMTLKFADKINKSAKDLGLSIPKNVESLEEKLKKQITEIDRYQKFLK